MQPTMNLRWVKKPPFERDGCVVEIRVLQQWWVAESSDHEYTTIEGNHGREEWVVTKRKENEWRDVPIEQEDVK